MECLKQTNEQKNDEKNEHKKFKWNNSRLNVNLLSDRTGHTKNYMLLVLEFTRKIFLFHVNFAFFKCFWTWKRKETKHEAKKIWNIFSASFISQSNSVIVCLGRAFWAMYTYQSRRKIYTVARLFNVHVVNDGFFSTIAEKKIAFKHRCCRYSI